MTAKWVKITAAAVAGSAVSMIGASWLAYEQATHVTNRQKEKCKELAISENTPDDNVWYVKQPLVEWRLNSADGLLLRASFIPAKADHRKVVILAHGINHAREQMIPYARWFHEHDYHVLMPDARAQGESGGHTIGFGWSDRLDYQAWVNQVITTLGDDVEIVLMGISMGAATVMAATGEGLPDNVKAVVADSGFQSVYKMAKHIVRTQYHLPTFPLVQIADRISQLKTGTRWVEENIGEQLQKSDIPVLLIHGEQDEVVPVKDVDVLYRALQGPKQRYVDPTANHVQAYSNDSERYWQTVSDFLEEHVKA